MALIEEFTQTLDEPINDVNNKFLSLISSFIAVSLDGKDYILKKIAEFYEMKTIQNYTRSLEDNPEYFENLQSEIDRLYAEPIPERNLNGEIKEIDNIIDPLHRQLCDQKTMRNKISGILNKSKSCPFCICHPNEEQKKFVEELTEAIKQIPSDKPIMIKYFELGLRRIELVEKQKQIEKIKKLKQYRQSCEAYLAGPKKKADLKQFLETNFEYEFGDVEFGSKLALPSTTRNLEPTTVTLTGGITMRMGKTSLNLFRHIDPVFNVLGLTFK